MSLPRGQQEPQGREYGLIVIHHQYASVRTLFLTHNSLTFTPISYKDVPNAYKFRINIKKVDNPCMKI